MIDIEGFLREARKAQLQQFYLHWFPGEEMAGAREKLMERLREAMRDPQKVRARFDRLSRSAREFLMALLAREEFRGTLAEIRAERRSRSIEDFEVESLLRSLLDEGLIATENSPGSDGGWQEMFQIPREMGDALRTTVDIEEREVAKMLSLRDLLGGREGEAEIERLAEPAEVERRIASLDDRKLADLVRLAIEQHGGVLTRSRHEPRGPQAADLKFHRPEWRRALEESRLGTTGVLSLRDFGIEVEEEGLLVFQELVLRSALEEAGREAPENDRELSLGVDLLVDLERILEIIHTENVEVTREGAIYKKTEERILPQLATAAHPELFDGDPAAQLVGMCRRLNFFDQDGARLRCDPIRRRAWMSKRPMAKLREVYGLLQAESRGERWSFHQGVLREIFLELLTQFKPGRWLLARSLFTATLASYLLNLKERGVDAEFRRRWNEDFHHEKLVVSLDKLNHDLSYWVLHRLALLGLVDCGYRDGKFQSVKLSPLGGQLLGIPLPPGEPGRLIVNPDFEILYFPGGEKEPEVTLTLSHFADRTRSERVKRYQINCESVKRGVISGMDIVAILGFLDTSATNPIPSNVRYSIREWGEGVEPIQRQRVLLLRSRSKKGADRLLAILESNGIPCERFGDNAIVIQGPKGERALRELKDGLRDQGLCLE